MNDTIPEDIDARHAAKLRPYPIVTKLPAGLTEQELALGYGAKAKP